MTPPVGGLVMLFIVFDPLSVTYVTGVEPPRDCRRVASLLFRDCTAVVLRRHGGDEGATAVRSLYGATAIMAVPLRFMPYKHGNGTAHPVCRGYSY